MQILNVSNIVDKNIVDKNIVHKNIVHRNIFHILNRYENFDYIDKKVQILNVSNIVHPNIVDTNMKTNIVHFWRGMKILSIYPNVGHSKSGFAHSFPRVDKWSCNFSFTFVKIISRDILKIISYITLPTHSNPISIFQVHLSSLCSSLPMFHYITLWTKKSYLFL